MGESGIAVARGNSQAERGLTGGCGTEKLVQIMDHPVYRLSVAV